MAIAGQEGYPYYAMVGPDGKLLGHLLDPDFKIYTAYALLRGRDGQSIKGSFNETFKAAGLLEDPANIDAVKRDYPVLFQVKRMYGVE
ncbi:hypothetical protein MKQ68_06615 [Chitinophaga horti]|uniref:Uncharacterized protein n=1 Tax=Chitinophaga horti TaxID=2920382 RepID=A0ABY6J859_9BACT|nr:hypothetical protein [Chitinophaga horti]UYQ94762.1 hypothetical protein MKQ68_06615 [Chitinophaga horti]